MNGNRVMNTLQLPGDSALHPQLSTSHLIYVSSHDSSISKLSVLHHAPPTRFIKPVIIIQMHLLSKAEPCAVLEQVLPQKVKRVSHSGFWFIKCIKVCKRVRVCVCKIYLMSAFPISKNPQIYHMTFIERVNPRHTHLYRKINCLNSSLA